MKSEEVKKAEEEELVKMILQEYLIADTIARVHQEETVELKASDIEEEVKKEQAIKGVVEDYAIASMIEDIHEQEMSNITLEDIYKFEASKQEHQEEKSVNWIIVSKESESNTPYLKIGESDEEDAAKEITLGDFQVNQPSAIWAFGPEIPEHLIRKENVGQLPKRGAALYATKQVDVKKGKRKTSKRILAIAATFIGMLLCSVAIIRQMNSAKLIEQQTDYGQNKTIILPDSSKVILNSNTKIKYADQWEKEEKREIELEGEAFFSVVHTRSNQKFIVKTASNMSVEVLGTEFTVKARSGGGKVILKSGKIKLLLEQDTSQQQIIMAPGEMIELTRKGDSFTEYTKKKVDTKDYTSWTQGRLVFHNTSVAEIKALLEEEYGLSVVIPDSQLLSQRISGTVPNDNLKSLLFALSNSFNCQIIHKNNQVYILEKDPK